MCCPGGNNVTAVKEEASFVSVASCAPKTLNYTPWTTKQLATTTAAKPATKPEQEAPQTNKAVKKEDGEL